MRASMDLVRPHYQPLHVQSSSDDSRLLTMLTPLHQAHPRCWTTARPELGRRGSGVADGSEYEGYLVLMRRGLAVGGE